MTVPRIVASILALDALAAQGAAMPDPTNALDIPPPLNPDMALAAIIMLLLVAALILLAVIAGS